MTDLIHVQFAGDTPVADSRDVAKGLDIKHESFMRTIRTHRETIEQDHGHLRFEIGTVENSVGAKNQVNYCLLTRKQFGFIATLSRNSEPVVKFKSKLCAALFEAEEQLRAIHQSSIPLQIEAEQAPLYDPNVDPLLIVSMDLMKRDFAQVKDIEDFKSVLRKGSALADEYEAIGLIEKEAEERRCNFGMDHIFDDPITTHAEFKEKGIKALPASISTPKTHGISPIYEYITRYTNHEETKARESGLKQVVIDYNWLGGRAKTRATKGFIGDIPRIMENEGYKRGTRDDNPVWIKDIKD